MKIKSALLIVLTVCLMVCLCACGGNNADNTSTSTTTTTSATTTTTTTAATTTTTTTASGKVTYTVTVTDEAGNPISGVPVQVCLENCIPTITNADGVATWNVDEADYKVSFWRDLPVGYTSDAQEFYFADGSYEMTIVLKAA